MSLFYISGKERRPLPEESLHLEQGLIFNDIYVQIFVTGCKDHFDNFGTVLIGNSAMSVQRQYSVDTQICVHFWWCYKTTEDNEQKV